MFNKHSADKQMNFQAEQSATAHQREVEDLRAAGLNPILSAGGQGASTPMGASATIGDLSTSFNSAQKLNEVEKPLNKATIVEKTANSAKMASEVDVNKANIETQKSQQLLNSASAAEADARALKVLKEAGLIDIDIKNRQKDYDTKFGERESNMGKNWQDVKESGSRIDRNYQDIKESDSRIVLNKAKAYEAGTTSARNMADVDRINQETKNLSQKYDLDRPLQDYNNNGATSGVSGYVRGLTRSILGK